MISTLTERLLKELSTAGRITHQSGKSALGDQWDPGIVIRWYERNRLIIFDIIRECSLGEQPNWDELNAILPTLQLPQ